LGWLATPETPTVLPARCGPIMRHFNDENKWESAVWASVSGNTKNIAMIHVMKILACIIVWGIDELFFYKCLDEVKLSSEMNRNFCLHSSSNER
jgi:hypothetical protein